MRGEPRARTEVVANGSAGLAADPHRVMTPPVPVDRAEDVRSAVVIDLIRFEDLPVPSEGILKRVYGLSPAEVRIAQGISRGDSLVEVATDTGIRITTARTHLASIFEKTNTRRQAKLVAILR